MDVCNEEQNMFMLVTTATVTCWYTITAQANCQARCTNNETEDSRLGML